ncbi:LysR family transcriptional regulator [Schauerella aestuarii]|uniref:LysR family transcriptional regulator n=1 Tax=Schauerella aestuarii TaxID=2511204 RepID=UPI00136BFD36|nr:LysR substrate-binding domain-containing protein [Achromobacter aestuarii]MYZ44741.1 LysR family transcriptional regulator [Achromobacter aestuarii]
MRLDLQDLKLVIAIARTGSITAGAGACFLAPASASERLKLLEGKLDVVLFKRESRGVTVTPAGFVVIRHAHDMLAQSEKLQLDLLHLSQGLQGEVRVATNFVARARLLDSPLIAFLRSNPRINVAFEEASSNEALQLVQQGKVELGVAALSDAHADLASRALFVDQLVAVTAKWHPIAAKERVNFVELLDYDFLTFQPSSALQKYIHAQAAALGRNLRSRVSADGVAMLCRMAEADVGVGIAPLSLVATARHTMAIEVTPISESWSKREIGIFWQPSMPTDSAAYRLMESLATTTLNDLESDP